MASSVKGMTIDIGGDTSKLQSALKQLNKPIQAIQKDLNGLNRSLKLDPGNTALLMNKQKALAQQISDTKNKVAILRKAVGELNEIQIKNGSLTDEQQELYRKLSSELAQAEVKLKGLEGQYKEFGFVAGQQIKLVGENVKGLGEKISKLGEKFAKFSAASAAMLGGIAKTAIDFESAWTGVTKTVDGTDEELAQVREGILKLASATGTSSTQIAGVAEAAGQLGVGVKDVTEFTETMVRLGDSTNLGAEEAATAIAQFYNIMNQDLSTVDRFGAALVDLGNNSATSESKIMDMASRIAGSASQIGLSSQEVLALATSLSSVGIEAEMGGSAISTIMTNIDKEVALNGKHLKTWASTAGMSSKEFKQAWETDTMSAIQAVVKGMGEVKDEGGNLNVLLEELGVKNIRQSDTMKRLSNASDLLTNSLQIANTAWEENSALTTESDKRYDTTAAKLGQVKETLKEVAIDIGEVILPYIKDFADKLKELTERFTNLDDGQKKTIVTILAIVAAIAPLLGILGGLISVIGTLIVSFALISIAISAISAPVLAIIAVVGVLIGIFVKLWTTNETFRTNVMNIWNTLSSFFTNYVLPIFMGFLNYWVGIFRTAFTVVTGIIKGLLNNATAIISGLIGVFSGILTYLQGVFTGNWRQAWEGIKRIFTSIVDSIKSIFSGAIDWISSKISGLVNMVTSIPDKIQGIKNSIGNIKVNIPGFASGGIVTGPTLAMVGEGRSAEAIIPLDKLPRLMAEAMRGTGTGVNLTIYTQELDSQKMEQIVRYVDKRFGAAL